MPAARVPREPGGAERADRRRPWSGSRRRTPTAPARRRRRGPGRPRPAAAPRPGGRPCPGSACPRAPPSSRATPAADRRARPARSRAGRTAAPAAAAAPRPRRARRGRRSPRARARTPTAPSPCRRSARRGRPAGPEPSGRYRAWNEPSVDCTRSRKPRISRASSTCPVRARATATNDASRGHTYRHFSDQAATAAPSGSCERVQVEQGARGPCPRTVRPRPGTVPAASQARCRSATDAAALTVAPRSSGRDPATTRARVEAAGSTTCVPARNVASVPTASGTRRPPGQRGEALEVERDGRVRGGGRLGDDDRRGRGVGGERPGGRGGDEQGRPGGDERRARRAPPVAAAAVRVARPRCARATTRRGVSAAVLDVLVVILHTRTIVGSCSGAGGRSRGRRVPLDGASGRLVRGRRRVLWANAACTLGGRVLTIGLSTLRWRVTESPRPSGEGRRTRDKTAGDVPVRRGHPRPTRTQ